MVWAISVVAMADEPVVDAAAKAQQLHHQGVLGLIGGGVGLGGGLAVLAIGRGPSDELSNETPFETNLRGVSGGILLVGGLTSALVGSYALTEAKAWREAADRPAVTLWVAPSGRIGVEGRW